MNTITVSEHTLIPELIKKEGWILDLGCINFSFAKELKNLCDNIICVDPNSNIKEIPEYCYFENKAISNSSDEEITFYEYNDIHGYSTLNPQNDWCYLTNVIKVKTCNISDIMKKYNINQFELIKFDIEGSEYEILNNIDWTISKQYSIEFHDFRNMNPNYPNNHLYYIDLEEKLLKYCDIVKHEITDHPGFPLNLGRNYWDSLFILKKEFWK